VSLDLDDRQRAMLEEMGVRHLVPPPKLGARLVEPDPHLGTAYGTPPSPPRQAGGRADLRPVVTERALVAKPAVDGMSWEALEQAVAARPASVFGGGDRQADCLVVADAPGEDEERQGEPFVGDAGALLDNMLAAVALTRTRGAYLTYLVKWRGSTATEDLAWCEAVLRRQVQLVRPKVIVVMGRRAVQTLLRTSEPPGSLQGRAHEYAGVPLVVTYPVVSLLRRPADKGKAWADLCLAMAQLPG
jgi:uracil-DNA glycosylase